MVYAGYLEDQIKAIAASVPGLVRISHKDMLGGSPHAN